MSELKVAILGSIPKGDQEREGWIDWKTEYMEKIKEVVPSARFLHGDLIGDQVGSELVVGHDLWIIKNADVVVVSAAAKIGAGTAQEMVLAKYFRKPLVSVVPKDTHHRRSKVVFHGVTVSDWIHPFIEISSDFIAENVDECATWINVHLEEFGDVKTLAVFDQAISSFEEKLPDFVESYRKEWVE
jgi:hypothetical protein